MNMQLCKGIEISLIMIIIYKIIFPHLFGLSIQVYIGRYPSDILFFFFFYCFHFFSHGISKSFDLNIIFIMPIQRINNLI